MQHVFCQLTPHDDVTFYPEIKQGHLVLGEVNVQHLDNKPGNRLLRFEILRSESDACFARMIYALVHKMTIPNGRELRDELENK